MGLWKEIQEDIKERREDRKEYKKHIRGIEKQERLKQGEILAKKKMEILRQAEEKRYRQKMMNRGNLGGGLSVDLPKIQSNLHSSIFGSPMQTSKPTTVIKRPSKRKTRIVYVYKRVKRRT